jgi:hypothetical protein
MAIRVEKKTTATLVCDTGRVLAWTQDKEPAHISLAVPGDRAKLTPVQARELATWLLEESERVTQANRPKVAPPRFGMSPNEKAIRERLAGRVQAW